MADSTMLDVTKMKVIDLRKELKARGLSYAGDKAELVNRLQTAMSQDDHAEINLDSDEIDSDGVLEEEDEKSHTDILDDTAVETLNEEIALAENPSPVKSPVDSKQPRGFKRKITMSEAKEKNDITQAAESKDSGAKKIILNRAVSVGTICKPTPKTTVDIDTQDLNKETDKVKITAEVDSKTKLEMRAIRFGLPVKMTEAERKEARKQRFGQNSSAVSTKISSSSLSENIDKLKKRAERFGQSVSKIMTDIENKEKLEKRKAKFGTAK